MKAIPASEDSLPRDHALVAHSFGYSMDEGCLREYDRQRQQFIDRCVQEGWENPRRLGYYILVDIGGVPTLMAGPDGYAWERGKYDPMNLWTNAWGRSEYLTFLRAPFDDARLDNVRRLPWARRWPWLARMLGDKLSIHLHELQDAAQNLEPFPPERP